MAVASTADGFVQTPAWLIDSMVADLFADAPPAAESVVLDPGCGEGDFIAGVLRYCDRERCAPPQLLGIELDSSRAAFAKTRFADTPQVEIRQQDFLRTTSLPPADFVIGNPPYVSLTNIAPPDRAFFRRRFRSATNRFDLYMLFFERALELLESGGCLSFVTPEKWLNVGSAARLRQQLAALQLERLRFVAEDAFGAYVTYPLVTQLRNTLTHSDTRIATRAGEAYSTRLSRDPEAWPSLRGKVSPPVRASAASLADLCLRIGCGPATGLDEAFLLDTELIPDDLLAYAHPTLSGKQLNGCAEPSPTQSFLMPYDRAGRLLPETELIPLLNRLSPKRSALEARSCAVRKPWYAYHETPAMRHLLRPKLLCRDITDEPKFYFDHSGTIVPRHSIYYLVPRDGITLEALHAAVSSERSRAWLRAHAQRAANGYLRIQSTLLKRMPVGGGAESDRARGEFELPPLSCANTVQTSQ